MADNAQFRAILDGGPAYQWWLLGYQAGVTAGHRIGHAEGFAEGETVGYENGQIQGRQDRASGEAKNRVARDALAVFYQQFDQAAAEIERGRQVAPEEAATRCYCPTERARQALQVEQDALEDAAHRENLRGITIPRRAVPLGIDGQPLKPKTPQQIRAQAEWSWRQVERDVERGRRSA